MQYSKIVTALNLPLVGFGTFRIKGRDAIYKSLDAALKAGYRLIDTAGVYGNETDIGACLKELLPKHNLTRADILITSKLSPRAQGKQACRKSCEDSLRDLQCDYLDLYLIHWPGVSGMNKGDQQQRTLRDESYKEIEVMHDEGKLKTIGVSNYTIKHLEELFGFCKVRPIVNQVEYHPYLVQTDLHEFCIKHNIQLEAYSSLGSDKSDLRDDKTVEDIAAKYNKSPAQILLKWAVQQDIMILPKSTTPERIQANFALFDFSISQDDMKCLNSFNKQHRFCWDPTDVA